MQVTVLVLVGQSSHSPLQRNHGQKHLMEPSPSLWNLDNQDPWKINRHNGSQSFTRLTVCHINTQDIGPWLAGILFNRVVPVDGGKVFSGLLWGSKRIASKLVRNSEQAIPNPVLRLVGISMYSTLSDHLGDNSFP